MGKKSKFLPLVNVELLGTEFVQIWIPRVDLIERPRMLKSNFNAVVYHQKPSSKPAGELSGHFPAKVSSVHKVPRKFKDDAWLSPDISQRNFLGDKVR